jgi:hypothetical protein
MTTTERTYDTPERAGIIEQRVKHTPLLVSRCLPH